MPAVADTSPLNYMVLIDAVDVLRTLFDRIIIPPAVLAELQHLNCPDVVRTWIAAAPSWLETRSPAAVDPALGLGRDEVEAIALAVELGTVPLLADDWQARQAAGARGLAVAGTLAVIAEAASRGLLNGNEALDRLANTNF